MKIFWNFLLIFSLNQKWVIALLSGIKPCRSLKTISGRVGFHEFPIWWNLHKLCTREIISISLLAKLNTGDIFLVQLVLHFRCIATVTCNTYDFMNLLSSITWAFHSVSLILDEERSRMGSCRLFMTQQTYSAIKLEKLG